MTPGTTINAVDCKKFALVVPTLNEAENIVTVLDRAREALSQLPLAWEILVVDDDSTDDTRAIVRRYSETHAGVRLLERHAQKGLAGAVTYGWKHTDADVLGVMDADLQHPPELLAELVTRVCQGSDIAIASRYLRSDSMEAWSLPRRTISRLSVLASRPVQGSGLRVRDPMSGFFVLRRECIEGSHFQPTGFKLLLEILAKGHIRSVAEIPFKFGTRRGGKSKANSMTAVYYFGLLGRLSFSSLFAALKRRAPFCGSKDEYSEPVLAAVKRDPDPPHYMQALLGILPLILGIQLLAWLIILPAAVRGRADFRQLYTAGYMVRSGHAKELYDYNAQLRFQNRLVSYGQVPLPFIRPAYYALLFVPFSVLSYRNSYFAFLGLNLILLCTSYWILRPWLRNIAGVWSWLPPLIFVAFFPVAAAFMQGQDSILLLTLLAAAFAYLNRGRDFIAGVLTGLGLFKFQIVIPIALLFLVWRRWRFTAGFSVSALVAGTLSLGLVGLEQSERYARSLISMNTGLSPRVNDLSYPIPVQFMANLHGLVVGVSGGHLPAFWVHMVAIALSGAVWLWVARVTPGHVLPVEAFPVAVASSVVVSYYLFLYDLSVLLIPITVLLDRQTQPRFAHRRSDHLAGWITVLAWVAPLCDPFIPPYRYLMSLPMCALLFVLVRYHRSPPANQGVDGLRNQSAEVRSLATHEAP